MGKISYSSERATKTISFLVSFATADAGKVAPLCAADSVNFSGALAYLISDDIFVLYSHSNCDKLFIGFKQRWQKEFAWQGNSTTVTNIL